MPARKRLLAIVVALIISVAIVNAAAFTYRWLAGVIRVAPPDEAVGIACTGFYSSARQRGIPLPRAGTNVGAPTYGDYTVEVYEGDVVCRFTQYDVTYELYESIEVRANVTVGSWYIKDFYGFGYWGRPRLDPVANLYLKVEDPADEIAFREAALLLYDADTGALLAKVDITKSGIVGPITLYPGQGVQLDLALDAHEAGEAYFKVGFYLSQYPEPPR